MRVPLFVLAAAELASAFQPTGAFQLASPVLSGTAVQGSRHAAVSSAVGPRVAGPLSALRSVARESGSEDAQMASARRIVLEKGAAGALALVLGANPLLAADEEEEVEEVAKPATVPREVTFKAQDKTCDAHPTWKQCRKKKVNENSPKTALDNGLVIQELVAGKGLSPQKGDTCTVHYSLYYEGSEIMSSRESSGLAAAPIGFQFGVKEGYGSVVPAINLGIDGLKVGGIRRITSPPELAFGAKGKPPRIPGGATVAFDVQLLSVKRAGSNPISSQGKGSTMF